MRSIEARAALKSLAVTFSVAVRAICGPIDGASACGGGAGPAGAGAGAAEEYSLRLSFSKLFEIADRSKARVSASLDATASSAANRAIGFCDDGLEANPTIDSTTALSPVAAHAHLL